MSQIAERVMEIPAGRQRKIFEYIQERGSAQIRELVEYTAVSEATIRRDLDEMDSLGVVIRTHGGAVTNETASTSFERLHSEKMNLNIELKQRIAGEAAKRINEGDTILLDTGSTSYYLAQRLSGIRNLTLITHDLFIAATVPMHETSTLVVTGGIRRSGYNVLVGTEVENFIRNTRVNKAFLSADAIDLTFGISNANLMEANIKRLLIEAGHEVILIADHTKLGRTALVKICNIEQVDSFIIDGKLSAEERKLVESLDTNIIYA